MLPLNSTEQLILTDVSSVETAPIVQEFTIAPAGDAVATEVAAVYPSVAELPENLLKFYLHFSGQCPAARLTSTSTCWPPMASRLRGFLELGEELWDPAGRRLTLFFDPGRIKRGLKPRRPGPVLEAGRRTRWSLMPHGAAVWLGLGG